MCSHCHSYPWIKNSYNKHRYYFSPRFSAIL
nr:MAG TPA: Diheme cytochrome c [Caudoviricetes sp.]